MKYYKNRTEYLTQKMPHTPCPNDCIQNRKIYNNDQIQCGTCFWNDIRLPYNMIPECSLCKQDYNSFVSSSEKDKHKFKSKCSKYCLWYDWFCMKRNTKNTY